MCVRGLCEHKQVCVSVCACCDRNSQGRGRSQAGVESALGARGHVLGVGDSRGQWAGPQSPRGPWALRAVGSTTEPERSLSASQPLPRLLRGAQSFAYPPRNGDPRAGFPGAAFTQWFPEAPGSGPGSLARRFHGHEWALTPRSLSSPVTGGTKEAMPPLSFLPLPHPHLPEASVRTPPTYPPIGPDLAPTP